ncbi:glutathione S-transferase-like [Nymphaea colorata]|nr:glutathione S-transferase-like [Nymphaea colorata]
MGVKVYGLARSTPTTRPLVCLEEKGVDYELVPVNLAAGAHKQQPFFTLYPFGQIPVFEDGDLKLFESRAISKYVAHRYKDIGTDLLGTSPAEMYSVGVWLEVEAHQFNPAIQPMLYELFLKPSRGETPDTTLVEAQGVKLGKVLDVYEEILAKRKYLGGDVFSLADLHHLPCTHYIMLTPYASLIASRKHVNAWWEDISSRPTWKKVSASMKF